MHGKEKPGVGSCRKGNKGATMGLTWELKTWVAGLGLCEKKAMHWACLVPALACHWAWQLGPELGLVNLKIGPA